MEGREGGRMREMGIRRRNEKKHKRKLEYKTGENKRKKGRERKIDG